MSATVTITLDTIAPDVTIGAIGGAVAGELLQVAYTSDEAVATATLVRGARRLALDVLVDRFEALIPVDWFDGPADIEVADDVGNATSRPVTISSTVTAPATAAPSYGTHSTFGVTPTPPRRIPLAPAQRVGRSTPVAFSSRAAISATPAAATAVALGSTAAARSIVARTHRVVTVVGSYTVASVNIDGVATAAAVASVTKRDGPDLEEAILLGLLG